MDPRPAPDDHARPASTPDEVVVRARSAADVVAAVPYLLGFVPTSSLVLISLRGPRLRVGLVTRSDLPDRPADATAVVSDAVQHLLRDGPRQALALVYDGAPWRRVGQPHRALVDEVRDRLAAAGAGLREALYVTADRFWSYTCSRRSCCPPEGSPVDTAAGSEVAAAYVLQGRSPLATRDDLRALVEPLGGPRPAAVARLAATTGPGAAGSGASASAPPSAVGPSVVRAGLIELDDVVRRYVAGGDRVCDVEAARLLVLLRDVAARDVVLLRWTRWADAMSRAPQEQADRMGELLARLAGPGDGLAAAARSHDSATAAVERFLLDLCTLASGRLALSPLVLVAAQAWAAGDGALAGVAIDRALAIDPRHRMSVLVDALLRSGLAPRWVAGVRAGDEALPA